MAESKRERFVRLAEARTNKILEMMRLLGNCSSKANYEYTEDDIKQILADHITHPVRFSDSLQKMIDLGVDTFIEIGPGKTLSGFVKKIETEKEINILNINNVETLDNVLNNLIK